MDLLLEKVKASKQNLSFKITGSKSESNRALVLQALLPNLKISNLSGSDDTTSLKKLLSDPFSPNHDVGHAGTAMRFGCAFLASMEGVNTILKGSNRMHERPIGVLVDALLKLGADISYVGKEDYPPLHIKGKRLSGGTVTIDGGISSQYLTGLLLISPTLEQGLRLKIEGEVTSRPYLDMTISLLEDLGVDVITQRPMDGHGGLLITVDPGPEITKNEIQVESDWSSAGYWYSWVAFQETGYTMSLSHFKQESWQGDSALKEIYHSFGVNTIHKGSTITLEKVEKDLPDTIMLNMSNEPDQAQTLFATCLGLGVNAHLTGLHTLKIKETDRIEAMKVVGSRFRESVITTTPDSIKFQVDAQTSVTNHFEVDTFHDHRMAMAFAPLCMFTDVLIKDAGVVSKSYPNYWQHLSEAGSEIQKS